MLVGTMWAAYLFAAHRLRVASPRRSNSTARPSLVLWLSSEFIQLVLLPIIIVGQNIQSRAADARATKTFEDVEDARKKIEHAIDLLDVHTEGGLHDAVALIVDAINEEGGAGRRRDLTGDQESRTPRRARRAADAAPPRPLRAAVTSRSDGSVAMATAAVAASSPAATEKASA